MKKLLFFTLLLIAVPSFFVLNIEEEIETKKNIEVEKLNTKTKKSDIKIKVKQEKIISEEQKKQALGVFAWNPPVRVRRKRKIRRNKKVPYKKKSRITPGTNRNDVKLLNVYTRKLTS